MSRLHSAWRTNEEITEIYRRNVKTVYRVCALFFRGNFHDAEDAVQTTFLKLMRDTTVFRGPEHEKAFLIVAAGNVCRDMLKRGFQKHETLGDSVLADRGAPPEYGETFRAVAALPDKLKIAVYLHYYEGWPCREIAKRMGRTEASIWRYLNEGRRLLKTALQEGNEYEK